MKNFLIVGGGIAGCSLAYQLAQKGCQITVVDAGNNVSTKVAGGVIIPLVFRRMTKSWRVDEFLPYAKQFYGELETASNQKILYPMALRRFFSSNQERNYWLTRQNTPEFSTYMNEVNEEDETCYPYANKFGSGRVKECYRVDAEWMTTALLNHPQITVVNQRFDYSALDATTATYQQQSYDCVVFCEGYESINNPWFSYLNVDPTKGEVLTVKTTGLSNTEVLNRKCSAAPIGNGMYKIGATYEWHTANTTVSERGKNELLEHLTCLTDQPVEVLDQIAGIRPTTVDRRPLMGLHPEFNKLAVFNGLGAKGFLLAPLLSKEMCAYLLEGKDLDKECVLQRIKA